MIKRTLIGLVCLLVLTTSITAFFLFTTTGLQASIAVVSRLTGGRVIVGSAEGYLAGNWHLENVTVHGEGADVSVARMACAWQPRALRQRVFHAAELSFANVVITLKPGGSSAPAETGALPQISLPLSVFIGSLEIDQLSLRKLGGAEIYTVDSLSARVSSTSNRVLFDDIVFTSPNLSGSMRGSLALVEEWPMEVEADWQLKLAGCSIIRGQLQVGRTLTDPLIDLRVSTPAPLDISVEVADLPGQFSYQAEVKGSPIPLGEICTSLPEAVVDLEVTLQGNADKTRGAAATRVLLPDTVPISSQFDFELEGQLLAIENGLLRYGPNGAAVDAELILSPKPSWDGVIVLDSFEISELLPVPSTLADARIRFVGNYDGEKITYSADIEDIEISVQEHDLRLGGYLSVAGDQQGLEIHTCRFDCGEGIIEVAGILNWTEGVRWAVDVQLESFDPSEVGSLPEGRVSGSFTSSGWVSEDELVVETEIGSLSGELSGYELSGGGNLVYRDQVLTISNINITNGNNRLYATGTVAERFDLNFVFFGAELESILPQLGGELDIIGVINGPRNDPKAQLTITGSDLKYQDYFAAELEAEIDLVPAEMSGKSRLQLENLQVGEFLAEMIEVSAVGSRESHQVSGALQWGRGSVQAEVSGSLTTDGWLGSVQGLIVKDNQYGTWQQHKLTELRVSRAEAAVGRTCLIYEENRICAAAAWTEPGAWSVSVDELNFALATLNGWGIIDKEVSGTLSGSTYLQGDRGGIVSGSGSLQVPELEMALDPNKYYENFSWFDTELEFYIDTGDLTASFSSEYVDGSHIEGVVVLPFATDLSTPAADLPLQGNINVDLKDVSALKTLTSDFLLPEGDLSGRFVLDGRVGSPSISGDVRLNNGHIRVPMLGVYLRDLNGTIEAGQGRLMLELDTVSGNGTLHASGNFDFGSEPWQGGLTFSGADVELLNRRMITVTADPELALTLGPDSGSLTGRVKVIQALIEVEKIDRSSSESSDVIFVDDLTESSPWPFHYNIEVALGNDVRVTGHGLEGRLEGLLTVASSPGNITVGRGHLDIVDGTFAVYGSPLTITRGRLTFIGGPVDDPSLDILAVKIIEDSQFGFSRVETGVKVTGSASDFEMELHSVPRMSKADILAYILLDRPFTTDGESGSAGLINEAAQAMGLTRGSQLLTEVGSMLPVDDIRLEGRIDTQETSVVVGKNLSSNLSVSWDYNLFQNAGSFRVRYEFGRGFSVESRNSLDSNAVELLYSLER